MTITPEDLEGQQVAVITILVAMAPEGTEEDARALGDLIEATALQTPPCDTRVLKPTGRVSDVTLRPLTVWDVEVLLP